MSWTSLRGIIAADVYINGEAPNPNGVMHIEALSR